MNRKCFNCENKGNEFYGFIVCDTCIKDLRLFTDDTVEKHKKKFSPTAYKKDVEDKLAVLENVYIKKKIKPLDILSTSQ